MNLADLSRLDIKDLQNLDYRKLWEDIRKRPDILVNIALVCLTILVAGHFILRHQIKISEINSQITTAARKIDAIEAYTQVKTELSEFTDQELPGLPEDEMLNKMTAFAGSRGIKIESISPVTTKQHGLHSTISLNLSITAKSYKDMWLFINDMEQSPYALRIDRWEGSAGADREHVQARLDITSIKIIHEK